VEFDSLGAWQRGSFGKVRRRTPGGEWHTGDLVGSALFADPCHAILRALGTPGGRRTVQRDHNGLDTTMGCGFGTRTGPITERRRRWLFRQKRSVSTLTKPRFDTGQAHCGPTRTRKCWPLWGVSAAVPAEGAATNGAWSRCSLGHRTLKRARPFVGCGGPSVPMRPLSADCVDGPGLGGLDCGFRRADPVPAVGGLFR